MRPELKAKIVIEAAVSPSEDIQKVVQAVVNIVGREDAEVRTGGGAVKFWSDDVESLSHFKEQLRDRHVRAAARRLLLGGVLEGRHTVMLNRQAAAVGVVALCGSPEESPLGPIYLTVESENFEEVVDWLAAYEG